MKLRRVCALLAIVLGLASPLFVAANPDNGGDDYHCHHVKIRTFDGTCNNKRHPLWGAAGQPFLTGPEGVEFGNGFNTSVTDRPNERTISNTIAKTDKFPPNSRDLSLMFTYFGQFITHDVSGVASNFFGPFIGIPIEDPEHDDFGNNTITFAVSEGTYDSKGRYVAFNDPTSFLDASTVYGFNSTVAELLRKKEKGLMKTHDFLDVTIGPGPGGSGGPTVTGTLMDWLPTQEDTGIAGPPGVLSTGDPRNLSNIGLHVIHGLFVREHNRLARLIAKKHPYWSDEQIYQKARHIVIGTIQHIVYDQWLPAVMGSQTWKLGHYMGYNPHVNPTTTTTFDSGSFRWGHMGIPTDEPLYSKCGVIDTSAGDNGGVANGGQLGLIPAVYVLIKGNGPESVARGLVYAPTKDFDILMADGLRNVVAATFDLFAIDIGRAREIGVPNYGTLRDMYYDPYASKEENSVYSEQCCVGDEYGDSLDCFKAITSDDELAKKLKDLYGKVSKIDAFVGLACEDHVPGSSLGPTTGTLMAEQFVRLRDGDRFWYEINDLLDRDDIAYIKSTSLGKILRDNFGINAQDNVFYVPNDPTDYAPASCS